MSNPVEPVLCMTVLMTYEEMDLLKKIADERCITENELARSFVLTGIVKDAAIA